MKEFLDIVDDLYAHIYKEGLANYEKHVIDVLYSFIYLYEYGKFTEKVYISCLEMMNILSNYKIENPQLIYVMDGLKLICVTYKRDLSYNDDITEDDLFNTGALSYLDMK